jgi:hypothetical protein
LDQGIFRQKSQRQEMHHDRLRLIMAQKSRQGLF